jgi:hypothetical protein
VLKGDIMEQPLIYDQTDIPPGMSCAEYRRHQRLHGTPPTRWGRIRTALHARRRRPKS